jgi:hypothetical protein
LTVVLGDISAESCPLFVIRKAALKVDRLLFWPKIGVER